MRHNSFRSQQIETAYIMNSYFDIIIAFTTSLFVSMIGLLCIIAYCKMYHLYDQPNARKVHKQAIPRLGGTIFMPAMVVGLVVSLQLRYSNEAIELRVSTILMILGAIMIYLIGIIDDLKGMFARTKFLIQAVAALFLPLCNLQINDLHGIFGIHAIPLWISYPLTVFVILLIVNAINLIDGIDGLASLLSILILGAYTLLYYELEAPLFYLLCASLTGSVTAFFFFNMFGKVGKWKTFMGDTGSLFLGYVIAYIAIKYQMSNSAIFDYRDNSLLISWTLVFIPCIDVIRVALFRLKNGKGMFDADKTHIHHLIMQAGASMHATLVCIILMFISFCLINWGLYIFNLNITWIILIDIIAYTLFVTAITALSSKNQNT